MKLKGKKLSGPQERIIVLPRQGEDANLVFKFKAVLDFTDFENLCPIPTAPQVLKPGGVRTQNLEAPEYLKAIDDWAMKKTHWSFLVSISPTDELEWETVKMGDPDTWKNYEIELGEAGLTESEKIRLLNVYSEVQGLDQSKIDEATKNFLATPQADTVVK